MVSKRQFIEEQIAEARGIVNEAFKKDYAPYKPVAFGVILQFLLEHTERKDGKPAFEAD